MISLVWRGRGYWVILLAAAAVLLPMIIVRQVEGPAADRAIGIAMGLAGAATLWLGLRWNRARAPGAPAEHSFWGVPVQVWALPMLVFALLLGTRTITTGEAPRPSRSTEAPLDGGPK